jgi:peptidoglycan-N-acetylglucosamine deacetylase
LVQNSFLKGVLRSLLESSAFPLEIIWRGRSPGKQLALTFDDGPDPNHTPRLLDALAELELVATFFLMGRKAEKHASIVREVLDRGHEIGNHSFDHNKYRVAPMKDFPYQIEKTNRVFKEAVGIRTRLFRPPYGKLSFPLLTYCIKHRIVIVMWSLDCRDSFGDSSMSLSSEAVRWAKNNDILLMHDDGALSRDIVLNEAPRLIDKGFSFTKITTMLESQNNNKKWSVPK